MDVNQIHDALAATYSPDPNVRIQAELKLREFQFVPGFPTALLQLLAVPQSDDTIKQAAAIYLKNLIAKKWNPAEDHAISQQDRDTIRQNLIQVMVHSSKKIRVQVTSCLGAVLKEDYPQNWPNFLPGVLDMLKSTDIATVHAGLLAYLELVKVFQWKKDAKREPLNDALQAGLPALLAICNHLLGTDDEEAGDMMRLALKTYFRSIQVNLSKHQREKDSLAAWVTVFLQTIAKDIPESKLPEDEQERERYSWWKAKKWAYTSLNKLFIRWGDPTADDSKKNTAWAKQFQSSVAPEILNAYLKQMELMISGRWTSSRAQHCIGTFLSESLKHKATWLLIKPHVESIVSYFIFPLMSFKEKDQDLWDEDPVEYIRKKNDPLEDFKSPVYAASNLLISMARQRNSATFMPILNYINSVLTSAKEAKQVDGALAMAGALASDLVDEDSKVKDEMENFIAFHVVPRMQAPEPFLRERACELILKFEDMEWKNRDHLVSAFQGVIKCLHDKELPVRVAAALALSSLLRESDLQTEVAPNVPYIMQELLKLTNEIDMDTLTETMESLVETYPEQLKPFATDLCTSLRDTFMRIAGEAVAEGNQEDPTDEYTEKMMAAVGILKTIGTLILSVDASRDVLEQLEIVVAPMIAYVFHDRLSDLYEEIFEIIDTCTYCGKIISPTMWAMFDHLYGVFKTEDGVAYIEDMLPCLENYVAYGKEDLWQNPERKEKIYDICHTVLTNPDLTDSDYAAACQLIERILLSAKGQVDDLIPRFLALAFEQLAKKDNSNLMQVMSLEIVINALYYNPVLTLQLLEQAGQTAFFFTTWFTNLPKFARLHDKKLSVMAIGRLLTLPVTSLPPSLQAGRSQLINGVLEIFSTIPEAIENYRQTRIVYGLESDEEADETYDDEEETIQQSQFEEDPDGDVGGNDADNYLDEIDAAIDNYADEGDDWGDEELEDDPYLDTEVEATDPYVVMQDAVSTLANVDPAGYQALMGGLSADQQREMQVIFSKADEAKRAASQQQK